MNKHLLIVLALALAGCAPTNPEKWMERQANACLPTAIAFKQGLRRQDVWADVFAYRFTDPADGRGTRRGGFVRGF